MNLDDNNRVDESTPGNQTTSRLHPRVYGLITGLVAWLVVSVWIFAGTGATDYLLAIVSSFIFIVVALQFILSRQRPVADDEERPAFRTWKSWDFDTWTGRLSGSHATVEILIPIAAVAFGMTAFGIVLRLVELTGT